MSQQQKTLKLVENNDLLSELPGEILSQLTSLLPLAEASRTCILSKSWKSIWTTHTDVVCNATSILELLPDESKDLDFLERHDQMDRFIKRVDQMMRQRCKGPDINSIVISFPLSEKHESHITSWISSAAMMGVEKINLDLTRCSGFVTLDVSSDVPKGYTFPFSVLTVPGKACTVKHLRLASCSISSLSVSNSLASLVTVELQSVNFTDQQLDVMLCNCLFLERMVLKSCPDLVNFKLTSRSSRLRFLAFKSCYRLMNIELYAENLEKLEYTGQFDRFLFKHVPKLAQAYFCFSGTNRAENATYALLRIANEIPRLEILNMISIQAISALQLPEGVPIFMNIKHLVLTVCPFHDDDKLCWISYILKAAPLLNNLRLNQFITSFTRRSKVNDRQLPEVAHKNLRELEINGYHGNQHEVELLKYLVDSAYKLDLLVISPRVKVYKGLNDCYREDSLFPGNKLSLEKIKELHSIVPKAVRVKYCN